MSYFSLVFARTDAGWIGAEVDLAEADGLDDITDIMRETAVETAGETVVLFVEEEDRWFAVVRMDDRDEPHVFLSDGGAAAFSDLARILYQAIGDPDESPPDDPCGESGLLADLGTDAARLTELGDRATPGEALSFLAEHAGFAEEFDLLR